MKRKIVRDPPVDILFIVGISIVLFISLNSAGLVAKIEAEQASKENYEHIALYDVLLESTMSQDGATDEEIRQSVIDFTDYLSRQNFANIYLENLPVQYNHRITTNRCAIVFSSIDEPRITDVKNGIFIGETLAKQVGSDALLIDGAKCPIVGTTENNMSGGIDTSAFLTWASMDDSLKKAFVERLNETILACNLRIASNSEFDDELSALSKELHEVYGITLEPYEYSYEGDYQNYWYQFYNEIYSVLSLIFSTIMCFSICDLWMQRRGKEFAIRKACGFSNAKLCAVLLKDILKLTLLSLLPMLLWQLLFNIIFNVSIVPQKGLLLTMGLFGIEILFFVLLIFLHMIREIKINSLAELVRK